MMMKIVATETVVHLSGYHICSDGAFNIMHGKQVNQYIGLM